MDNLYIQKVVSMKKLLGVAFIILTILGLIVTGCTTSPPKTTQYVQKYTADRVIYIVQSQYPVAYTRISSFSPQTPTSVTAVYIDKAVWKVQISCPQGYWLGAWNSGVSSKTLYFYEADGSLWNNYSYSTKALSN
jgi:hypothetical protein